MATPAAISSHLAPGRLRLKPLQPEKPFTMPRQIIAARDPRQISSHQRI